MMYSRRFSEGGVDLPPDYGGVAYRGERENDARAEGAQNGGAPEEERENERARAEDAYEKAGLSGRRDPRRPLYEDQSDRPERPDRVYPDREVPRFSFSGRNFRLDDIILAGLILLLIGDRDKVQQPDSELLLILGLLLLSK